MDLQQKKKYSSFLGEPLHLESPNPATQETEKIDSTSMAVRPSNDIKTDKLYQNWIMLSPREQQVTALTCLRYTNPQISAYLEISKETVRTYLEKVLNKFGLQTKADLRVMFANWDFSEWERPYR
jgi:DNA-binding CsgD family transcriptional regulator